VPQSYPKGESKPDERSERDRDSPPILPVMKLPYVIDNQTHVLAEILKGLLTEHKGRSLDVATAYFTVGGFGLVQEERQNECVMTSRFFS
jgi:hypothetical protein